MFQLRENSIILADIRLWKAIFICADCCFEKLFYIFLTMAAIPHGAFAAKKIRENEEKLKLHDHCESGPNPTKYASKYMKSVWGMYNRYSVHNIKQNFDLSQASDEKMNQTKSGSLAADKKSADLGAFRVPIPKFWPVYGVL